MSPNDRAAANRLTEIRHRVGAQTPFLTLSYTAYNTRSMPTTVVETREGVVSTITYTYDARGRLTHESRLAGPPNTQYNYDLEYSYDQGGNRKTKIDYVHQTTTTYYYDTDPPAPTTWLPTLPSKANRLRGYEVLSDLDNALQRVTYEYHLDGPAAGNVSRVTRRVEQPGSPTPFLFVEVYDTIFSYNRAGEVWIVTLREWSEFGGFPSDPVTVAIREFRGNGQTRYLMRDREIGTQTPIHSTSVWTDYDGVSPYADFTVANVGGNAVFTEKNAYELGLAQIDQAGTVSYVHNDQIGSTQATSSPATTAHAVYTAFGELIRHDAALNTRYLYSGSFGYETFGELAPDFPFPLVHAGAGWYDPESGRTLQLIFGALGARYTQYADPLLTTGGDGGGGPPSGDPGRIYVRIPGHSEVWFPRSDGSYNVYDLTPVGVGKGAKKGEPKVKGGIVSIVPGQINERVKEKPPTGGEWYPATAEQNEADQTAIRRQKSNPPKYQFFGIGGTNCMFWASDWATMHYWPPAIGAYCFVQGTIIATPEGSMWIEGVLPGMNIIGKSFEGGCLVESCSVRSVSEGRALVAVNIALPGESICTTPEHRWYVLGKGWVKAINLRTGDCLLSMSGESVTVNAVEVVRFARPVPVYNLHVDGNQNYHVGRARVLVHNKP